MVTRLKYCFLVILLFIVAICCQSNLSSKEITGEDAIQIASKYANNNKFNTANTSVELIKVKSGVERGPIRLVWLFRHFPKEKSQEIINNELWIVYFYPKGQLQKADTLGGDFCVLVELHSGHIIASAAGL